MKIRIYETEIEADARELRGSNTLAGNFANLLSRAFQNRELFEDEEIEEMSYCYSCSFAKLIIS